MLVLARRLNEQFYIGDDITITVVSIKPGVVRIGVEAPRDVLVLRDDAGPRRRGRPIYGPQSPGDGPKDESGKDGDG